MLLIALAVSEPAGAQPQLDLRQAEALVRAGNALQAYQLLEPHEFEQAGNVEFDYVLGIAALEAGKPDKATLVLERVLLVNPNHAGARLDLARAYYLLGDLDNARNEFRILLAQNPPEAARLTIDRYLALIEQRVIPGSTRGSAYLEVTLGYDTNVNAATSQNQIFLPAFGFTLQLDPNSRSVKDLYGSVGAGGDVQYAVTRDFSMFAGGDARVRLNESANPFDYNQYDVRVGMQYAADRDVVRAVSNYQAYHLDNRHYREISGLGVEWRRLLSERQTVGLFGLGSRVRYQDTLQEVNDVNQTVGGASFTHVLDAASRRVVSASVYAGYERDIGQRIDGDRKFYGVRLTGRQGLADRLDLFGAIAYQDSPYQTRNALFRETRNDRQVEATLGLGWEVADKWVVRPQLTFLRNASNIPINTYSRYDFSVTLRRDFH